MEYENCAKCGKVFLVTSGPMCETCAKEEEQVFQDLREYLDNNPNNSIATTSEETGIPIKKILKFLKEGRIELTPGVAAEGFLRCERCNVPITMGIMCGKCRAEYEKAAQEVMQEQNKKERNKRDPGHGMHSMNTNNDGKTRR